MPQPVAMWIVLFSLLWTTLKQKQTQILKDKYQFVIWNSFGLVCRFIGGEWQLISTNDKRSALLWRGIRLIFCLVHNSWMNSKNAEYERYQSIQLNMNNSFQQLHLFSLLMCYNNYNLWLLVAYSLCIQFTVIAELKFLWAWFSEISTV